MTEATILVVEDNEILRQGIQLLLETDGYKVVAAANGQDALFKMHGCNLDLILSDISMPKMDGFELFEAVRARPEYVTIPFVFLTARGGREEVFKGKNLGAEDYLVKPVNRQELLTTVRSRLARSQELLLAQLQQAYQASMIVLANAIELRDRYTRGHVERVMDYSLAIARWMGLNSGQMNFLRFGSILHDIGKIYISEKILSKPGPLTDEEWTEMKRHPVIGAELIQNIPFLEPALPVVKYHHECWNGAGYPEGLAGEQIPLDARIVAVADSLDAMSTSRVYRKALTPEECYQEIMDCRGSLYDPSVVEAFIKAWNDILPIIS